MIALPLPAAIVVSTMVSLSTTITVVAIAVVVISIRVMAAFAVAIPVKRFVWTHEIVAIEGEEVIRGLCGIRVREASDEGNRVLDVLTGLDLP